MKKQFHIFLITCLCSCLLLNACKNRTQGTWVNKESATSLFISDSLLVISQPNNQIVYSVISRRDNSYLIKSMTCKDTSLINFHLVHEKLGLSFNNGELNVDSSLSFERSEVQFFDWVSYKIDSEQLVGMWSPIDDSSTILIIDSLANHRAFVGHKGNYLVTFEKYSS